MAVLDCAGLGWTGLGWAALCCAVMWCPILGCATLYRAVLCVAVPRCSVLCAVPVVLCWTVPRRSTCRLALFALWGGGKGERGDEAKGHIDEDKGGLGVGERGKMRRSWGGGGELQPHTPTNELLLPTLGSCYLAP